MSLSVCPLHPGLCWSPTPCPTPMAGVLPAVCWGGGCMCPQKEGVSGWPGKASEIMHSGAHPPSLKVLVTQEERPAEGRPSPRFHPPGPRGAAPVSFPFRLGLWQGRPQLRHIPGTAQAKQGLLGPQDSLPSQHVGPYPAFLSSLEQLQAILSLSF